VLPKIVVPEVKVPGLILKDASVSPMVGKLKDNFVFSITVIGVNVTQELQELVNHTTLVKLEIDGRITLVVDRVGNASDLSTGILYSMDVSGNILGVGNHTFRFLCEYDNVSGDVRIHDGPQVKKSSDSGEGTGFGAIAAIIAVILILIIMIPIIIFLLFRKRSGESVDKDQPQKQEEHITQQQPVKRTPIQPAATPPKYKAHHGDKTHMNTMTAPTPDYKKSRSDDPEPDEEIIEWEEENLKKY
jgi:hypothetical protein